MMWQFIYGIKTQKQDISSAKMVKAENNYINISKIITLRQKIVKYFVKSNNGT